MMTQPPIGYRSTDISEIDLIRALWEELNEHHLTNARAFRDVYSHWTFEDRKAYFTRIAQAGSLRLDLTRDPASGHYVGYCVSSISYGREGEIESVSVRKAYRSQGIGTALITRALAWLERENPVRIRVSVADGNENAFSYYRRFGFHPRFTVLEQRKD